MFKQILIEAGLNALKAALYSKPDGKFLAWLKSEKVKNTIEDIYRAYKTIVF